MNDPFLCEYKDCDKEADRVVNEKPGDYDGEHNYYCAEHSVIVALERGTTADEI